MRSVSHPVVETFAARKKRQPCGAAPPAAAAALPPPERIKNAGFPMLSWGNGTLNIYLKAFIMCKQTVGG